MIEGGAWGAGLATYSGDRILEVFYPAPQLGGEGQSAVTELNALDAESQGLPGQPRTDGRRDVRTAAVRTRIADLRTPPRNTADAYLRLHLLSHRLVKPHSINLEGLFGVLPNVAWTSLG